MKDIHLFGFLGLFASMMVGTGEFLVHFNPIILDSSSGYSGFLDIPESRLTLGHFIMVYFSAFYIFGYWHLYLALKPGSFKLATTVLLIGFFSLIIGGIWLGSRAHLGVMLQALNGANMPGLSEKLMASYNLHFGYLIQVLRALVLLSSICFTWAILKGGTLYPKWMVFFNPFLILLIVFALNIFVHPVGQYLAPTAMNVAHFVLFTASLFALENKHLNRMRQ